MNYIVEQLELKITEEQAWFLECLDTPYEVIEDYILLIDVSEEFYFDNFNRVKDQDFQYECFYSLDQCIGDKLEKIFNKYPELKEVFEEDLIVSISGEELGENENMTDREFHAWANPNLK